MKQVFPSRHSQRLAVQQPRALDPVYFTRLAVRLRINCPARWFVVSGRADVRPPDRTV
jgi:hypothetical protein